MLELFSRGRMEDYDKTSDRKRKDSIHLLRIFFPWKKKAGMDPITAPTFQINEIDSSVTSSSPCSSHHSPPLANYALAHHSSTVQCLQAHVNIYVCVCTDVVLHGSTAVPVVEDTTESRPLAYDCLTAIWNSHTMNNDVGPFFLHLSSFSDYETDQTVLEHKSRNREIKRTLIIYRYDHTEPVFSFSSFSSQMFDRVYWMLVAWGTDSRRKESSLPI